MPDQQPPGDNPAIIERLGIRTERYRPDTVDHDLIRATTGPLGELLAAAAQMLEHITAADDYADAAKLDRWRKALHGGGVVARNMATGGAIIMSSPQAHELIDQLAIQLHRPDLVVAHQFRPQRRDQPGMQPQPRKPS